MPTMLISLPRSSILISQWTTLDMSGGVLLAIERITTLGARETTLLDQFATLAG